MGLDNFSQELIEIILLLIKDEQTLLLAQRVCRRWALLIQGSRALQQALFYQPIESTPPKKTTPRQNPLLAAKFPYWFPKEDQIFRDILYGAGDMQYFLDKHAAWLRPSASWRRMLVQQPPAMSLGWIDRQETFTAHVVMRQWELSLEEYGGLRMNMLYDLVVRSAEKAAQFFYWRMHWNRPGLERSSIRCNPDIQMDSIDYYLEAMMSANAQTDIVLDTWSTLHPGPHIKMEFGKDTWSWELVEGLESPMGDVNLDAVYASRKAKEPRSWEVSLETWYAEEVHGFGDGYPLLGDSDPDL
ncbi:hypothetical protein N7447_001229 [Penicillium robsamsonii]|uniref:uncharacterized protein n=1 Tax=Penicillium robsamsonii TaxID=1792511 RepID=UPI002547C564|nr:uncharacterized protein N7447_001229 [Penicillium robsamsonii]KAJ5835203.1 hypothetical protein N7447_001229 [Penicillium robsamsonii]